MREDWAEKLRRKLEGHRKTPPPGLWEGISKEMGFEAEPVSKPAVMKRLYWAVAAAVLALVGFFVVYNNSDIEQPQLANAVSQLPASEKLTSEQPTSEQPTAEKPISKQLVSKKPTPKKPTPKKPTPKKPSYEEPTSETPASEQPVFNQLAEKSEEHSEQILSTEEEEKPTEDVRIEHGMQGNHHYPLSTIHYPLHSHSNKWSLGVNASGGLLAANTSQRMNRIYYIYSENYMVDINEQGEKSNLAYYSSYSYTLTEYKSKHHLPIRFGVSLNYQLTPRIALHSGISYTYLYSEFSIPLYEEANYDQKLHYLGIPLGVSWQLWSTDHFQFYVSGGAMLEKCVNTEIDGNSVSKKPWQWSVDAAAGAEYSIIPQLGFYLEPSLGYYFNDGTALEHYYKKHPLTPTIEFGLRLHLNK